MSCRHIRFIGGGRWATILLTELVKNFPDMTIDWVCQSNLEKKSGIIRSADIYKNVLLVDSKDIADLHRPDKVIIASHSSQHCHDFVVYKDEAVDILVEKPLFSSFSTFESLSDQRQQSVFLNLEFYNAFFIADFYQEVKSTRFEKIDIFWHDPLCEERPSEEGKYSEIYSSIFMDQLLHVMSICKMLNLDASKCKNIKVLSDKSKHLNSINIQYDLGDIAMSISLSRFADKRERRIVLNDGAAELYFSGKPNYCENGQFIKELTPSGRMFPIAQTLNNFLNHPQTTTASSLSLKSLISEIKFCLECEDAFTVSISDWVNTYSEYNFNADNISPELVYYAGIMYYRKISKSRSSGNIHYLKGDLGVSELVRWWADYSRSDSK